MLNLTKKNVLSNFAGSIWVALIGFLFIPIYLKHLGAAGYGLIGLQTTLIASIAILDLGFGSAASREMARLGNGLSLAKARNLIFSLEVLFWAASFVISIFLYFLAPIIVDKWVNSQELDRGVQILSLQLIALSLFFNFPVALYSGCISGLMHQVALNIINIVFSTLRYGGAAYIVAYHGVGLEGFFAWQVIVVAFNVLCLKFYLSKQTADQTASSFDRQELKRISKFAIGVSGVNILGLLLTQVDKIILSKMLSLENFGYYMVAWTIGGAVYKLSFPIYNAVFPKLTQMYQSFSEQELSIFYQKSTQLMALVVVPITVFISIYSYDLILIWSGSELTATKVYKSASYLCLGIMINALTLIPYGLQLAMGWTQLALMTSVLSVIIYVPLVIGLTHFYEMPALAWFVMNLVSMLFACNYLYKKIFKNIKYEWYLYSVLVPILGSLIIFSLTKNIYVVQLSSFLNVIQMAAFLALGFVIIVFLMPYTRKEFFGILKGLRR